MYVRTILSRLFRTKGGWQKLEWNFRSKFHFALRHYNDRRRIKKVSSIFFEWNIAKTMEVFCEKKCWKITLETDVRNWMKFYWSSFRLLLCLSTLGIKSTNIVSFDNLFFRFGDGLLMELLFEGSKICISDFFCWKGHNWFLKYFYLNYYFYLIYWNTLIQTYVPIFVTYVCRVI